MNRTSQLRGDARGDDGLALVKFVAFTKNYSPEVNYVDKSRDWATGISHRERYGVSKASVVKEEMQSGGVFKKCIEAAIDEDGSELKESGACSRLQLL
jgi:SOS response regulatory protein OraA/RecX